MTGARVVTAALDADPRVVVQALRLPPVNGVVVLNGGAEDLPADVGPRVQALLREGLVRVAVEDALLIITGGTDTGIFRLLGEVVPTGQPPLPLVGVAPAGLVQVPGRPATEAGAVPLEPHHTGFVLVESEEWGAETPLMLSLVDELSRASPSVAVLASGGPVARRELGGHVRAGRPVVVLSGSGRLADEVAEAMRRPEAHADLARILTAGRVLAFDLDREPSELASMIRRELSGPPEAD